MPSEMQLDLMHEVDCLIKKHIAQSSQTDSEGRRVASVSAADKFSWAKHSGAELDFVEQRLHTICDDVTPPGDKNVVPLFRLTTRE